MVPAKEVYQVLATKRRQNRAFRKPRSACRISSGGKPARSRRSSCLRRRGDEQRLQRPHRCVQNESNLQIVWSGGIYDFDSRPSPRVPRVRSRHASSSPSPSSRSSRRPMPRTSPMARRTPRPCRCWMKSAWRRCPPRRRTLPTVAMDVTFWADYGEQLEQRFNARAAR